MTRTGRALAQIHRQRQCYRRFHRLVRLIDTENFLMSNRAVLLRLAAAPTLRLEAFPILRIYHRSKMFILKYSLSVE